VLALGLRSNSSLHRMQHLSTTIATYDPDGFIHVYKFWAYKWHPMFLHAAGWQIGGALANIWVTTSFYHVLSLRLYWAKQHMDCLKPITRPLKQPSNEIRVQPHVLFLSPKTHPAHRN